VILVDTVFYLAAPQCAATDLRAAAIAFDNEQVAGLKPESVKLLLSQFKAMQVIEVERTAMDVCDPKIRIVVSGGLSVWRLLQPALRFSNLIE
jgi:hypothetical protein